MRLMIFKAKPPQMRFNVPDPLSLRIRGERAHGPVTSMPCPGNAMFAIPKKESHHQAPVFSIDIHGSAGARLAPFCNISIEIPSGERTNAI